MLVVMLINMVNFITIVSPCFPAHDKVGACRVSHVCVLLQMARKKAAKAAELEEDALIVEYLRQRQLKEQVCLPSPLPLRNVPALWSAHKQPVRPLVRNQTHKSAHRLGNASKQ